MDRPLPPPPEGSEGGPMPSGGDMDMGVLAAAVAAAAGGSITLSRATPQDFARAMPPPPRPQGADGSLAAARPSDLGSALERLGLNRSACVTVSRAVLPDPFTSARAALGHFNRSAPPPPREEEEAAVKAVVADLAAAALGALPDDAFSGASASGGYALPVPVSNLVTLALLGADGSAPLAGLLPALLALTPEQRARAAMLLRMAVVAALDGSIVVANLSAPVDPAQFSNAAVDDSSSTTSTMALDARRLQLSSSVDADVVYTCAAFDDASGTWGTGSCTTEGSEEDALTGEVAITCSCPAGSTVAVTTSVVIVTNSDAFAATASAVAASGGGPIEPSALYQAPGGAASNGAAGDSGSRSPLGAGGIAGIAVGGVAIVVAVAALLAKAAGFTFTVKATAATVAASPAPATATAAVPASSDVAVLVTSEAEPVDPSPSPSAPSGTAV